MIAPLRQTDPEPAVPNPPLSDVHRAILTSLLPDRSTDGECAPSVAAWRAWLVAAWVVFATVAYFAYMFGVL